MLHILEDIPITPINKTVNMKLKHLLHLCLFLVTTSGIYAQVAINKDGSPPDPSSILHVKGSGGNHFFIHDITGNVGIGTLNPSERLHIVGNLKLSGLNTGLGSDSLLVWSPVDSTLKIISPGRLGMNNVAFATIGNVTSNSPGDLANDDFVFGSDNLNYSGPFYTSRMFFDKSKSAFRAGNSSTTSWNESNLGMYSTGFGIATVASGDYSFASGSANTASGEASTAMGRNSTASGMNSTVLGSYLTASGENSTAIGYFSQAQGISSVAIGNDSDAIGHSSIAIGYKSIANGDSSVVIGRNSNANGISSFATGYFNTSDGTASMSAGYNNTASGDFSFAGGDTNTASGEASAAFGQNTQATDDYAVAFGKGTTASGEGSLAAGLNTTAGGYASFALGNNTSALASYSMAAGENTEAQGLSSLAMGANVIAYSGYETVFGRYNTSYTPNSTLGWNGQDRLFTVGNGTGSGSRSDAIVILKNGKVGINTSTPNARLTVIGDENDGTIGALEIGTNSSSDRIFIDGDEIDSNNPLFINANSTAPVAIGSHDIANGYIVSVGGKMIAEEVRVQLKTAWPDYVFHKDYTLPTLGQVDQFIKEKKHLPGIPSAKEIEESGLHLGEMEVKLMEKIEELTLYFIELDYRIKKLETLKDEGNE